MKTPFFTPPDSKLTEMLDHLKKVRGEPHEWGNKDIAVKKWIANLPLGERVLALGEYRTRSLHAPGVLTYSDPSDTVRVWYPKGDDLTMIPDNPRYFFSTIPHEGICREVFNDQKQNTTV